MFIAKLSFHGRSVGAECSLVALLWSAENHSRSDGYKHPAPPEPPLLPQNINILGNLKRRC
jgi:hypothetical protein